jgi:parallel beta-helix repeat protein
MRRTLAFAALLALLFLAAPLAMAAEGRTPIWLAGTGINADGRYVVTRNLTGGAGVPMIDIRANRVDLDLNGFTLDGAFADTAIVISAPNPEEIVIHNGLIVNCPRAIERIAGLPPAGTVVIEDMQIRWATNTAIYLSDVENPVIRRVNIRGGEDVAVSNNGIHLDGPQVFKNGTIEHNTIRSTFDAIRVYKGSALAIRHNRIETPFRDGILVEQCVGCLIEKNTISDADMHGIHLSIGTTDLEYSTGTKVYNNVVHRGEQRGIILDFGCDDNLILDNVMRQCGWGGAPNPGFGGGHGLEVNSSRNHIEGNTMNFNDACGMLLRGPNNTFGRNMARGNDPAPIGWCGPCPFGLFPPDSCDMAGANDTFGDNLIPGPPIF